MVNVLVKNEENEKTVWLELPMEEEDIDKILKTIEVVEDEDGEIPSISVIECESDYEDLDTDDITEVDELYELSELIDEIDDIDEDIVNALLYCGVTLDEVPSRADDVIVYSDCWNMADVAEVYLEETGMLSDIPEDLRFYFDYEKYGDDMKISGNFYDTGKGKFIEVVF